MASWDVALTVVYPILVEISDGYLIRDRIYYGRLFIGSKSKLVQRKGFLYYVQEMMVLLGYNIILYTIVVDVSDVFIGLLAIGLNIETSYSHLISKYVPSICISNI